MDGYAVAEVLYKAAAYMGEHGKCEEKYEDDDGAVCAFGAIGRAENTMELRESRDGAYWRPKYTFAATTFSWWLNTRYNEQVITWSDHNDTEDVILGLKQCAHDLETGVMQASSG